MDVGLKILERSDMLASSTLEQLRKSTDRSYTLFGFLMTGFSAVTGLLLAAKESWLLIPGLILWTGLGVSLYIMFSQVIWVHSFRCTGNEPQNLISTRNIKIIAVNVVWLKIIPYLCVVFKSIAAPKLRKIKQKIRNI